MPEPFQQLVAVRRKNPPGTCSPLHFSLPPFQLVQVTQLAESEPSKIKVEFYVSTVS